MRCYRTASAGERDNGSMRLVRRYREHSVSAVRTLPRHLRNRHKHSKVEPLSRSLPLAVLYQWHPPAKRSVEDCVAHQHWLRDENNRSGPTDTEPRAVASGIKTQAARPVESTQLLITSWVKTDNQGIDTYMAVLTGFNVLREDFALYMLGTGEPPRHIKPMEDHRNHKRAKTVPL